MSGTAIKQVLDVCCGSRMMWFDRKDSRACGSELKILLNGQVAKALLLRRKQHTRPSATLKRKYPHAAPSKRVQPYANQMHMAEIFQRIVVTSEEFHGNQTRNQQTQRPGYFYPEGPETIPPR